MKIGLALPQMGGFTSRNAVKTFAQEADKLGFDSLWAQEHLFYPLEPVDKVSEGKGLWPAVYREMIAPMELLSFVAAITENIEIGTSILVSGYHRPLYLAKQAASIDKLSNGRFILGLGLGWSTAEYELMETPFKKRGARQNEFMEVLLACFGDNPVEFEGDFFNIPISETSPKPYRGSSVKLLGGWWSESGMERAAKYCDVWNAGPHSVDDAVASINTINAIAKEKYQRGPVSLNYKVNIYPLLPGINSIDNPKMPIPIPTWGGDLNTMEAELIKCKNAGIDEITLDMNYFEQVSSEEHWQQLPEFLAPLVDIAHA